MTRLLIVLAAALALVLMVGAPVRAAEDTKDIHEGKVVSITGDKLVMLGTSNKEHTHTMDAAAKISCDGKECKLSDLKVGQRIRVTTKKGDPLTAVKVEALDKERDFPKLGK
jgi:hypothetical protein